jgi:uncharacterized protein YndB with AHSA1/START domain
MDEPSTGGTLVGPLGFAITTKSKDFRTGKSWMYAIHGPDGVDYLNHIKFF